MAKAGQNSTSEKPKRAANFTEAEKEALVTALRARVNLISDKHSATVTKTTRDDAWKEILESVNAVSAVSRSMDEVKKKYQAMKSDVKQVESGNRREINKTGGGEAKLVTLSATERELLGTLTEASIVGIAGGLELFDDEGSFGLLNK